MIDSSTIIDELERSIKDSGEDRRVNHLYILCPTCEREQADPSVTVCGLQIKARFSTEKSGTGDRCPKCVSYVIKRNENKQASYQQCSACGVGTFGRRGA